VAEKALTVEEEHFKYLVLQRGDIEHLSSDFDRWLVAYNRRLAETYRSIRPFLPPDCHKVLDIGSGLGGINALINDHYGGGMDICLLDGVRDPPVMLAHRRTFNHMEVARDFLWKNGVYVFSYYSPQLGYPRPFDLITSYRSWCFHYPPSVYLDFVVSCCHPDTILIVDLRRKMPEWYEALCKPFRVVGAVHASDKCDRIAFQCR
jgi:SAM-dependent methyltransferase